MSIAQTAKTLANRLRQLQLRVVFAESCTAGLVSASLARVAGISDWHCGSAVTYRNRTKEDWLGIAASVIERETAVCEKVAVQMARGVLANTAEANLSASVTGHLGPHAPQGLDGVVYVAMASRTKTRIMTVGVGRFQLREKTRYRRQREAAELVLRCLVEHLNGVGSLFS